MVSYYKTLTAVSGSENKLVPHLDEVMYSIRPVHCDNIANFRKRIEVRKTKPKFNSVPFKGFIYCTKPKGKFDYGLCIDIGANGTYKKIGLLAKCNYDAAERMNISILSGKVIGEFICNQINEYEFVCGHYEHNGDLADMCLSQEELDSYGKGKTLYGICIQDLKIYDKPKEITEFWNHDKCPYNNNGNCMYDVHCYRSGEVKRCGERLRRPPQSWCYVNT